MREEQERQIHEDIDTLIGHHDTRSSLPSAARDVLTAARHRARIRSLVRSLGEQAARSLVLDLLIELSTDAELDVLKRVFEEAKDTPPATHPVSDALR